jgi:hypothetical protein
VVGRAASLDEFDPKLGGSALDRQKRAIHLDCYASGARTSFKKLLHSFVICKRPAARSEECWEGHLPSPFFEAG